MLERVLLVALQCLIIFFGQVAGEKFSEELFIKRLRTGHVYTHSQFVTHSSLTGKEGDSHYNLFPKSFGQIIKKYHVAELHLSLTHGRWRHQVWGYPIQSAPHGAELWVWFSSNIKPQSIDSQWAGLVNALSGQFCASLNYLNKDVTSSPLVSFRPMGLWPKEKMNHTAYLRYAVLPKENVCTENLTPWKKLLPCESKAGISTLFNSLHLYDSSYHSLAIHLRSVCKDDSCKSTSLELKQTLSSVYDPIIADLQEVWSLGKLFGEVLKSACPLASTSKVLIDTSVGSGNSGLQLEPQPSSYETKHLHGKEFRYAVYDLKTQDFRLPFDIRVKTVNLPKAGKIAAPTIYARRYTTGHREERGGVVSLITNEHASKTLKISYLDILPWYMPVYVHTLTMEVGSDIVKPDFFKFIPAKDRVRPTIVEAVFSIPPKSTLKVSFSFGRSALRWNEYPPDSSHGFYLSSVVIGTILPDASNLTGISERCSSISGNCIGHSPLFLRIHTESSLVVLPTPDFSMPYNVICLTLTFQASIMCYFKMADRMLLLAVKGQAKTLNLSNKNLKKLPGIIGKVSSLRTLILKCNLLVDLPKELVFLIQLEVLNLGNNKLEKIPDILEHLTSLKSLHLFNNSITELSPKPLSGLTCLTLLNLNNNHLKALPPEINRLSCLEYLSIDNNELTELPVEICHLLKLVELHAANNQLQSLPGAIAFLRDLKKIYIQKNQIEYLPEGLSKCKRLEVLDISVNSLRYFPGELVKLSLKELYCEQNNLLQHLPVESIQDEEVLPLKELTARFILTSLKDSSSYLRMKIMYNQVAQNMLSAASDCAVCGNPFLNTWLECVRFVDSAKVLGTKTKCGLIPLRGLICSYKCFNREGHDYYGIAQVEKQS
eukprot:gene19072-20987_t